jgi:hypothetical protein
MLEEVMLGVSAETSYRLRLSNKPTVGLNPASARNYFDCRHVYTYICTSRFLSTHLPQRIDTT